MIDISNGLPVLLTSFESFESDPEFCPLVYSLVSEPSCDGITIGTSQSINMYSSDLNASGSYLISVLAKTVTGIPTDQTS